MTWSEMTLPPERRFSIRSHEALDSQTRIREMEHRIKNHLQLLAAYVRLTAKDPQITLETFAQDIAEKLAVIASTHDALQDVGASCQAVAFLRLVCRPFAGPHARLEVNCDPAFEFSPDQLAPIGMIVSEAVSNAIKHAFRPGTFGRVEIHLTSVGQVLELAIRDDGRGLGHAGATHSNGLELITRFARQLGGVAYIADRPSGGVEVLTVFPKARRAEPPNIG